MCTKIVLPCCPQAYQAAKKKDLIAMTSLTAASKYAGAGKSPSECAKVAAANQLAKEAAKEAAKEVERQKASKVTPAKKGGKRKAGTLTASEHTLSFAYPSGLRLTCASVHVDR